MSVPFDTTNILGFRYAELQYTEACEVVAEWCDEGSRRMIAGAPVSSLIMARRDERMHDAMDRADMITSDGMPLVWMRRLMGRTNATRLYGPELMLRLLAMCVEHNIPVALLGGRPERMQGLTDEITRRFPEIRIPYAVSPPFRELTDDEMERTCEDIAVSGARLVFVAVGSPKQEILMRRMAEHLPAVQIGVGAAFDLIPGHVRQAPAWMQRSGLEWAFRLACEPRRLWKRYATTIPPFAFAACAQLTAHVFTNRAAAA